MAQTKATTLLDRTGLKLKTTIKLLSLLLQSAENYKISNKNFIR